jgi:3-oxoacyl-[acyl-carrier-protein] synthase-3
VATTDHRLVGGVAAAATEWNHLCRGSADTGFEPNAAMSMNTNAETLLNSGCALAAATWRSFCDMLGWTGESIAKFYGHQVGQAHWDRLVEVLGLDPRKSLATYPAFGNVGSVSLPLTMAMGVERDPPPAGADIAMLGIGSGLVSVMLGAKW